MRTRGLQMRIIKRGALEQFWEVHPDARPSLESWYQVGRRANWKTPAEMKQVYPKALWDRTRSDFAYPGWEPAGGVRLRRNGESEA